jgi:hypothetical protein
LNAIKLEQIGFEPRPALQDIAIEFVTLNGCAIGAYDWATDSGYRCKGVVTSLLKSPERLGQKEYTKMLYLQVDSTNAAALGLYQKFGFITKTNY